MTNSYGPWATLIDVGRNPQLSAFWKRRLAMLASAHQTSPVLSKRNAVLLIAAAFSRCLLPTFRAAPAVAGPQKADDRAAAEAKWSARYKYVENTPSYTPPDDEINLPFIYNGLLRYAKKLNLSTEQVRKLRDISNEYVAGQMKLREAQNELENLPADERQAKSQQIVAKLIEQRKVLSKEVDAVLTPEQLAALKNATLQWTAKYEYKDDTFHLGLSDQQQKQLAKLIADERKEEAQAFHDYPDKALAVLSPQQREKLLEKFKDTDVAAPGISVPPFRDANQGTVTYTLFDVPPRPFEFWFRSASGARVGVYAELMDEPTRKELGVSKDQEAKLSAISAVSKKAADDIFRLYEPDYGALKTLSPEAQKEKQAEYEAKRPEFRQKLEALANDMRRQIETTLKPEQVVALRTIILRRRALAALIAPERDTRDYIDASQQQREELLQLDEQVRGDAERFDRASRGDPLKILTPQQRQKLVEELDRRGW